MKLPLNVSCDISWDVIKKQLKLLFYWLKKLVFKYVYQVIMFTLCGFQLFGDIHCTKPHFNGWIHLTLIHCTVNNTKLHIKKRKINKNVILLICDASHNFVPVSRNPLSICVRARFDFGLSKCEFKESATCENSPDKFMQIALRVRH